MDKPLTEKQRLYDLVVVGASAGGIEALSLLVATLPESLSVPIVIAQHLDPRATSHLGQILTRRSKLPVRTVSGDAPEHLIEGVIYIIPENWDVEIADDIVHLLPGAGQRPMPSIDRLLTSAAHAYGERLIAVILTGSGSDGTAGAREVKAAGGAVLIENPATASYPAMPASLAPTTVDLVVDLERMGPLIADLISGAQDLASQGASELLPGLLEKVRQHTGIDFAQYKSPTILRRLARRMAATGAETLPDYSRFLDGRPEEYQHLVASFLINVTEFFRDQPLFNYLREQVIPDMISHAREGGKTLRIWSAGCATGEEPYSIAMLLAEALGTEALQFNIRIFATDVDADAIAFARRGQYPTASLATLPDDLRTRYFAPTERGYEVTKSIRNMVVFGEHDLGQRAPFPHMDMVVCRNVLIYFTNELQMRTLHAFAFSLRESGYLVLGAAETAGALGAYFNLVHPHFRVYRRRGDRVAPPPLPIGGDKGRRPYEPLSVLAGPPPTALGSGELRRAPVGEQAVSPLPVYSEPAIAREIGQRVHTSRERFADQILNMPMGMVVIDRNYDVQTINSAAYTLLDIHRPAVGKDLLHLATRVPTKPLRAAIDAVFSGEGDATTSGAMTINVELEQSEQEDRHILQIACYPSTYVDNAPTGDVSPTVEAVILLISKTTSAKRSQGAPSIAEAAPTPGEEKAPGARREAAQAEEIARLTQQLEGERALNHELRAANQELRESTDSLRRANEDLLVAQEELQASSEETITLNEEMQATNEELETLNEELEATVEELHTTNDDLQARAQELQTLAQEKEAQRQTSERGRAQLEAVLLSMGDALLAVDATGKPTLTNEAYQRLFGDANSHLAIEDVLGNPLPPEAAPWRRVGEDEPFTLAFTIRMPDGSQRWFEATGQPIRAGESKLGGVVTIRDLSDRSIRGLYERFLGRASHEIKNPLTALMVTIQMIQRQLPAVAASERLQTLAANALRYARQVDVMANDLKDLQRIQHDKLELTLEPVDLVALAHQAADDIELTLPPNEPHPPIVVQAQPGIEPFLVLGDSLRITQVVQNLLANALKYAPDSERIDVRVRRVHKQDAPDMAELEVQDYGPGIGAADMEFLFTPFYQALHERATQRGGLGLGLYIVQQLVKALGGEVTARSSEGHGAAFTIQLPLITEGQQAAPDTETAAGK